MSFVASGAVVLAGATVAGAAISANASKQAAKSQAGAANNATQLQQNIYDQNQANLAPYMQQGNAANLRLADMLGTSGNTGASGYGSLTQPFTAQDYLNNQDPGFGFQLAQGNQALSNSLAAGNGVLSGSAVKDLINFNQGMASTGYQNAWNRWNTQQGNTYQRLSGMAGLGENAAAMSGNQGVQSGANMANTITGAGNAIAAGTVGSANAISSGLSNLGGYYYMNNMNNRSTTMPVSSSDPYGYGSGQDLIANFGG